MVLDLLALAVVPTAIGASEAVHQQRLLDEEAESEERQAPFYLDVFCDAKSSKRDEVHDAIIVLKDGKVQKPLSSPQPATHALTQADHAATIMAQRPSHRSPESRPR